MRYERICAIIETILCVCTNSSRCFIFGKTDAGVGNIRRLRTSLREDSTRGKVSAVQVFSRPVQTSFSRLQHKYSRERLLRKRAAPRFYKIRKAAFFSASVRFAALKELKVYRSSREAFCGFEKGNPRRSFTRRRFCLTA